MKANASGLWPGICITVKVTPPTSILSPSFMTVAEAGPGSPPVEPHAKWPLRIVQGVARAQARRLGQQLFQAGRPLAGPPASIRLVMLEGPPLLDREQVGRVGRVLNDPDLDTPFEPSRTHQRLAQRFEGLVDGVGTSAQLELAVLRTSLEPRKRSGIFLPARGDECRRDQQRLHRAPGDPQRYDRTVISSELRK